MASSKSGTGSRQTQIMAFILVISLGLNAVLILKRTEVFPAKKELIELNKKLDTKLNQAKNELNKYRGISDKIDQVVLDAQEKIAANERQIASLRRDKKKLLEENENLLSEVDSLRENYLDVIDSLLVEQNKNHVLNSRIDLLEEEVTRLNTRLGVAGMLAGDNLRVIPKKETLTGKIAQSALARKVSEIELCIDVLPNRITKAGIKDLYIIITAPNGTILSENEAEPALFDHPEYDKQARYSLTQRFDYANQKVTVCTDFVPVQNLSSGLYVAEFFTKENKLGMTTFSLK